MLPLWPLFCLTAIVVVDGPSLLCTHSHNEKHLALHYRKLADPEILEEHGDFEHLSKNSKRSLLNFYLAHKRLRR